MSEVKLAKIETKLEESMKSVSQSISNLEGKVSKLEDNNETLTKLSVLMEMQVERDIKQNKQLEKFGEVLANVDTNLSMLNSRHDQLKLDIDNIGSKVKHIEKTHEEVQEKNKINMPELWTTIVKRTFLIIPTIILTAVLVWLGLK